ncbi:hypothetical protein BKA93DRAFT_831280 [Sparassis latifolia]
MATPPSTWRSPRQSNGTVRRHVCFRRLKGISATAVQQRRAVPLLAVAEAPRSLATPRSTCLHHSSTLSFTRRPTTMNDGAPVVTPAYTLRLALPQAV